MAVQETYESVKKQVEKAQFEYMIKVQQRQNFMDKADEMRRVYDKLAEDKRNVEGQRNIICQVRDNRFEDFKGDVYNNRYLTQLDNIINSYNRVINGIDANMDALNWKIAEVQNEAYSLDGPLGFLEKGINRLNTRLENWVN